MKIINKHLLASNIRTMNNLIGLSLIAGIGISSCKGPDRKPNIVFIFIDDLGWTDLGYMGSEYYLTDLLTDQAVSFIKENNPKETNKPFFVYLSHHAVHTPIQAKQDIIEDFESKPASACHDNATYAAMIKSIDESVDSINKVLEDLKLSKNTLAQINARKRDELLDELIQWQKKIKAPIPGLQNPDYYNNNKDLP